MKKILISILTILCLASVCYGQTTPDQDLDFQEGPGQTPTRPIYRAPSKQGIPVHGYYLSVMNTLFIDFSYSMGEVDVTIENLNTGDFYCGSIPSDSGIQAIPLPDNTSEYVITLTLETGKRYIASLFL